MKIDADKVRAVIAYEKKRARFIGSYFAISAIKRIECGIEEIISEEKAKAQRPESAGFEIDLFDEMEFYPNCSVQVLHNTYTDEYSVGWWNNERSGENDISAEDTEP